MSLRTLSQQKLSTSNYAKIKPPVVKGSVYFDGTGDYLSINSTSALGFGSSADFTVESWIRPDSQSTSQILVTGNSSTFAMRLGAGYGSALNGLQVTLAFASDFDYCNQTFTASTWYHVAIVRQSGVIKFFVNGTQKTTVGSGAGSYNWPNETSSKIGAGATPTYENYKGYISNLRVVKGSALYTANFAAPTAPLTAISGTSLLTCQSPSTITDASPNAWSVTANGNAAANALHPFA